MMGTVAPKWDFTERSGMLPRATPRQADFMLVSGTISKKMAPVIQRLYAQMADPKWVVAMGSCSISGGPFRDSYAVVKGADKIIPVDVYIPGCPPRPEALMYGLIKLQEKIMEEHRLQDKLKG